jgi:hypothetical protein
VQQDGGLAFLCLQSKRWLLELDGLPVPFAPTTTVQRCSKISSQLRGANRSEPA